MVGSVFSSFSSISLALVPLPPAICQRGREGPISLAVSVRSLEAHQSLLVHLSWQAFPHSICLICRAEKLPREDKVRKSTSGGEERQAVPPLFLRTRTDSEKLGHRAEVFTGGNALLMFSAASRQGHCREASLN